MFQITVDVRSLTAAERLHVAQFITEYPTLGVDEDNEDVSEVMGFEITSEDEDEIPNPSSSFGPALVPTPPPPVISSSSSVSVDKAGLPWDERIHSSNKQFVADGTWRKRRGVTDELVAQVEAELFHLMNIHVTPMPVAAIVPPPPSVPADEAPIMPMQNASTVPAPPPLPAVPPPPPVATVPMTAANPGASVAAQTPAPVAAPPVTPAPTAVEPNAYLNLIQLVTKILTEKKLTRDEIDTVVKSVDPALNLQLLQKRPDLIPQVAASIRALAA